ncbi:MAG: HlyD family efflux transporter periplasmic adaptor subunit [Lachnospiraceae bacterium]|nr:HlyD family efflux transporter periplasmic adaptor subunit [Lachnospiraceae bacterium]
MDKHNKREIVKNIAIVFLVIMLILTFFSNTILNRTLPEVSTQMITSGTVSSQVRGEGNVETEDPYNLTINETRKIKGVLKREGDHVDVGDIIYTLEGEVSEELTTAKNDLEELKQEYDLSVIDSGLSSAEAAQIEAGVTVKTGSILSVLEAKDKEATALRGQLDEKNKQKDDLEYKISLEENSSADPTDTSAEERALEAAENALDAAKDRLSNAKETLESYIAAKEAIETKNTAIENYHRAYDEYYGTSETMGAKEKCDKAEMDYDAKKSDYKKKYDDYQKKVEDYQTKSSEYLADPSNADKEKAMKDAEIAKNNAQTAMDNALKAKDKAEIDFNAAKTAKENAQSALTVAEQAMKEAEAIQVIVPTEEEMNAAQNEVNSAQQDVTAKEAQVADARKKLNDKKNSGSSSSNESALKKELKEVEKSIEELNDKIEKIEKERDDFLSEEKTKLGLEKKYQEVLKKQEEIKELEEKALGGEIKSPVAGTIVSTAYSTGEKTEAGGTVAVIQIDGKGYKLSFPVSAKEARNVKVGDDVTIENSWYYGDIQVNLVAIQPDKTNTRDGKILVFSLTGDSVQAGQNITLSVGQKSSNYDFIVPISALHEDNDGNFILIMQERSTPFGTRYIAKKVEAKVLAKDDKVAAIDAELLGYEYVITNSSKELEKGDQVKLAE